MMVSRQWRVVLNALVALTIGLVSPVVLGQARRAQVSAEVNYSALHPGQDALVAVVIDIKKGFHAQSHTPRDPNLIPLTVTPGKHGQAKLGEPVYPPGHDETYEALGTINVYTGKVVVFVPVKIAADATLGEVELSGETSFQICDDKSCFEPQTETWRTRTKVVAASEPAVANQPDLFKGYQVAATRAATTRSATPVVKPAARGESGEWVPFSEEKFAELRRAGEPNRQPGRPPVEAAQAKHDWSISFALAAAFFVGLIFNVMPCVLPVLPIKVIGFYEVAQHHRARSLMLSMYFSLGMIAVFAVLAVLVVVLKVVGWSQLTANPYFQWTIIGVLAVLSLGLFGAFSVALPTSVYTWTPRHDTVMGNVLFGVLTALLATPCTAPLLPALIAWAATQPVALGIAAMMMVGVGMASPYVVLSAFPEAARRLPRAGPWSELFKQMMGFLLLGSAIFFAAGRLIQGPAFWWAMVPVALVASLYLVARSVKLAESARPVVISSVIAILLAGSTVFLAAYMNGIVGRGQEGDVSPLSTSARPPREGKIVLVKFTANWCLNCQLVEATVFHDPQVWQALKQMEVVTMKADLTNQSAPGWPRLRSEEPSGGIPLTAIYVPGYERPINLDSVYTSATLIQTLEQVSRLK